MVNLWVQVLGKQEADELFNYFPEQLMTIMSNILGLYGIDQNGQDLLNNTVANKAVDATEKVADPCRSLLLPRWRFSDLAPCRHGCMHHD